ncbi:transposase [Paenibacillus sp. BR2-3]|uniref:transposase n=1 Tax=Paenibacillus sp. BR2-3 TaxID=3048494 RepID=UPI00397782BC
MSKQPFYKERSGKGIIAERGWICLAVRRMAEPESVFGQLKNNQRFPRLLLRCMANTTLKVGWLSHAHNLQKQAPTDRKQKLARLQ